MYLRLISLALAATGALATDYRLLVQKGNCTSMADFKQTFEGYCPYYAPAIKQCLSYHGLIFEAGDYHGQHADEQARVACLFTDEKTGEVIQQTTALVEVLGGSTEVQ